MRPEPARPQPPPPQPPPRRSSGSGGGGAAVNLTLASLRLEPDRREPGVPQSSKGHDYALVGFNAAFYAMPSRYFGYGLDVNGWFWGETVSPLLVYSYDRKPTGFYFGPGFVFRLWRLRFPFAGGVGLFAGRHKEGDEGEDTTTSDEQVLSDEENAKESGGGDADKDQSFGTAYWSAGVGLGVFRLQQSTFIDLTFKVTKLNLNKDFTHASGWHRNPTILSLGIGISGD